MSIRENINILRTINEISFIDEMNEKYGLSEQEIELFSFVKSWHLGGLFNNTKFLCRHHFKGKTDEIISFVEKYKACLPLVEIAKIKEKIWNIDRSKYQYGKSSVELYLALSEIYSDDEKPNQYIYISLDYLYRSYKFTKSTKNSDLEQRIISQIANYLSFNVLSSSLKVELIYFIVNLKIESLYDNVKNIANTIINEKITIDNEGGYRHKLYPNLLKLELIDQEFIAQKLFDYVTDLEKPNPLLAERICRELQKFVIEKGLKKFIAKDLDSKIASLSEQGRIQLLSSGTQVIIETMSQVKLPDLSGMKIEEILDLFFSFSLINKDEVLENINSNVIFKIASISSEDSEGRKRSDNSISDMSSIIGSPYFIMFVTERQQNIHSLLLSMQKHTDFKRENIRIYYKTLIPEQFCNSVADALYFFIREDFHISLPVITPRFESFLKLCLNSRNILPSKTTTDKLDHPQGLGNLLEASINENMISKKEKFEIDCFLFDEHSAGKIVRHEVAHGSLTDESMSDTYKINALWLILRIITNTSKTNNFISN